MSLSFWHSVYHVTRHFTKNAFNTGDHEMEKAGSHDSFVLLLTLLVNETLKKATRQNSQDIHWVLVYIKEKNSKSYFKSHCACEWLTARFRWNEQTNYYCSLLTCNNLMLTMPELQRWDNIRLQSGRNSICTEIDGNEWLIYFPC